MRPECKFSWSLIFGLNSWFWDTWQYCGSVFKWHCRLYHVICTISCDLPFYFIFSMSYGRFINTAMRPAIFFHCTVNYEAWVIQSIGDFVLLKILESDWNSSFNILKVSYFYLCSADCDLRFHALFGWWCAVSLLFCNSDTSKSLFFLGVPALKLQFKTIFQASQTSYMARILIFNLRPLSREPNMSPQNLILSFLLCQKNLTQGHINSGNKEKERVT